METPSCKFYPRHGSSRAWKRAPPPPRASHKPWSSEHNLLLASTLSRDAIFDLLSPSLSHPAIFIWRFHFPLPLYPRKGSPSVSRSLPPPLSTLCKTAPEFVRSPIRLHFITVLHFTVHTLRSNVCRSGCDSMSRGVPSRFQSGPLSLTSDAPINSADPFGGSRSRSLAPESCLH